MDLGFINGRVLRAEGFSDRPLWLSGGRFADEGEGRAVDVQGYWLLPGVIDLHGDGFERHVAPRRGLVLDMAPAFEAIAAELASCGITTAWLAQFWSWEGGMRGPDFATRLAQALTDARPRQRLDIRLQLRLETHMVDDAQAVGALIAEHGIDYLVLNDHLPHDRLREGRTPPRLQGGAAKARRSPSEHLGIMQALEVRAQEVPGFLSEMADLCRQRGIVLGSHDDETAEGRARFADLGCKVAEFPTTREAAEAARASGDAVVMGAPNVVRGSSHNRGGVSAQDLVAAGLVDALASDYHYPSLVASAFALTERGVLPFEEAWRLISTGPARVMGLTDRGQIGVDQRADLVLIDPETRRVEGVFAAGRPVWLSGRLADRVLAMGGDRQ